MLRFVLLALACCCIDVGSISADEQIANADFVLHAAPYGTSDYVAFRLQTSTGKSWYAKNGNWQPVVDSDTLPKGRFKVQLVSSGDGEQKNWNAFRINVDTGRSWRLDAGKWVAMQALTDE